MGKVTVPVAYHVVGRFLDLVEEPIVAVRQDDARCVCHFTLDVSGMADCLADVMGVTDDDERVTHWLVPRMPDVPQVTIAIKYADVVALWRELSAGRG